MPSANASKAARSNGSFQPLHNPEYIAADQAGIVQLRMETDQLGWAKPQPSQTGGKVCDAAQK